jgi:hypothetical protein
VLFVKFIDKRARRESNPQPSDPKPLWAAEINTEINKGVGNRDYRRKRALLSSKGRLCDQSSKEIPAVKKH